jgi:hypothetical protein
MGKPKKESRATGRERVLGILACALLCFNIGCKKEPTEQQGINLDQLAAEPATAAAPGSAAPTAEAQRSDRPTPIDPGEDLGGAGTGSDTAAAGGGAAAAAPPAATTPPAAAAPPKAGSGEPKQGLVGSPPSGNAKKGDAKKGKKAAPPTGEKQEDKAPVVDKSKRTRTFKERKGVSKKRLPGSDG